MYHYLFICKDCFIWHMETFSEMRETQRDIVSTTLSVKLQDGRSGSGSGSEVRVRGQGQRSVPRPADVCELEG